MQAAAAPTATFRAIRNFALVAAASAAAASIWASGIPEEALLLDAQMWQEEVAAGSQWPQDGWYRLQPRGASLEVQAVVPGAATPSPAAAEAVYFRLPGATLRQGERPMLQSIAALQRPRLGQDHEMRLGTARFSLRVESGAKGMQYSIGYGGQAYTYTLGPFDAESTSVRAVADIDGDTWPDFLVDVGDTATYLLLSSRARPGRNLPTAQLYAHGC